MSKEINNQQRPEGSQVKILEKERFAHKIKKYCWRLTGLYFWIYVIALVTGARPMLSQLEGSVLNAVVSALSSVGFAPVNPTYLPPILKIGWVLIVTGVRPLALLGLAFYLIFFPFGAVIYLLVKIWEKRKRSKKGSAAPIPATEIPEKPTKGLLPSKTRHQVPWLTLFALSLFSLFLLYGDANSHRVLIPSIILSGAIFVQLSFRMFMRTAPPSETRGTFFTWLKKVSTWALNWSKNTYEKEFKHKSEVDTAITAYVVLRNLYVRGAVVMRGQEALVSFLVLAEYILSLIMVAATGILFLGAFNQKHTAPCHVSLAESPR